MIYTIDTIPAKLFFKIDNTGDYTLLSDDNSFKKEYLQKVWESILFYYQKNVQGKARDSQLDLDKKINSLFTLTKDENSLVEFFEFTFVKFYRKPFQGTGLVYENYTQLEFFIKPTKKTNGLENQDLGGLYGLGRLEIELITSSVLGERQIQFTNQFALHFNS